MGDDADQALFRRAIAGARPLKQQVRDPERRKRSARALSRRADEREVPEESLLLDAEALGIETGGELTFQRPWINAATFKRQRPALRSYCSWQGPGLRHAWPGAQGSGQPVAAQERPGAGILFCPHQRWRQRRAPCAARALVPGSVGIAFRDGYLNYFAQHGRGIGAAHQAQRQFKHVALDRPLQVPGQHS